MQVVCYEDVIDLHDKLSEFPFAFWSCKYHWLHQITYLAYCSDWCDMQGFTGLNVTCVLADASSSALCFYHRAAFWALQCRFQSRHALRLFRSWMVLQVLSLWSRDDACAAHKHQIILLLFLFAWHIHMFYVICGVMQHGIQYNI